MELSSRSRLSSVCWSSYIKSYLAAADYEGVLALWDVHTNTELMQVRGVRAPGLSAARRCSLHS